MKGRMPATLLLVVVCWLAACKNKAPATKSQHTNHSVTEPRSGYPDSVNKGLIKTDTLKGSPRRMAMLQLGATHVHITYHSPGIKNRVIWGGLVPYDQVWVTGAHNATTIQFSSPIRIGDQRVEPGTYAIFTIPGREQWIVLLNKNYRQHLTDEYKAAEDVVRMSVRPAAHAMTERLTYTLDSGGTNAGLITMAWEKLAISIPFQTIE